MDSNELHSVDELAIRKAENSLAGKESWQQTQGRERERDVHLYTLDVKLC